MHTHTLWAARVAAGTVLPDKRLLARLACILETFAERPSDAIPQAAGSWGQAKGIYRFLANQRVLPAALHQGLTSDTARQCLDQTTVLVVQDTTSLHLTGCHMLPELGPIGSGNLAQGVLLHSTLALTEQGAVLGVLGLQTWARPAGNAPGPEAKESGKWLHGIDQARQVVWETAWAAGAAAPPRLMHLMDREGDGYEVLQWGGGVWGPKRAPGGEALHWLLWPGEPAAALAGVQGVVRKSPCRWQVEEYHLTLKSGCRIEALRLESWDSLEKAVVMYTSVAARIVALRDRAQQEPDAPATVLLSEDGCAVLVAKFGKGQAVLRLTLGQAVLWIGRLGGHLNRQRDGMRSEERRVGKECRSRWSPYH